MPFNDNLARPQSNSKNRFWYHINILGSYFNNPTDLILLGCVCELDFVGEGFGGLSLYSNIYLIFKKKKIERTWDTSILYVIE